MFGTFSKSTALNKTGKLGVLGLLVLAMSACGSTSASEASGDEQVVRIGVSTSLNSTSLYLGMNEGIFEESGLKLELSPITSMSEGVTQLMSKNLDYVFGDVHNTILAQTESVPVAMAAPVSVGAEKDPEDGRGFGNLFVLKDSGISSLEDLEGKTIATSSLNGTGRLDIETVLERNGVETSKLKWVSVAGPQQMAALRQGQVDAATIPEPTASKAISEGDVNSLISGDAALPKAPLYGLIATDQWITENREVASKLSDAMLDANQLANADREAALEAVRSFTELDESVIQELRLPKFAEKEFQPEDAASTVERMVDFGLVEDGQSIDLERIFTRF